MVNKVTEEKMLSQDEDLREQCKTETKRMEKYHEAEKIGFQKIIDVLQKEKK